MLQGLCFFLEETFPALIFEKKEIKWRKLRSREISIKLNISCKMFQKDERQLIFFIRSWNVHLPFRSCARMHLIMGVVLPIGLLMM